ncbi:MAG TPA: ABC transporter permease [Gaiellaceae bacterium]|jgi:ribose/xylose/arabinose/galactoside ABC-type transport system permease subunit|nr:ABC transporter permease [Gaiellaceae bacterium]
MANITSPIATTTDGAAVDTRRRLRWAGAAVARLGGVTLAVLVVGAYFSIRTHGQLLVGDNLLGILRGLSTIAIMGFGLTPVIIAAEIDLSFAAVYGLSTNIVAVLWVTHGWPVYVAVLVAFLAAIGVGLFNAFFTAVVKIPSFIATLGSSTLVFGLTLYVGQTQNISYQYPPPGHEVPKGEESFFGHLGNASLPGKFPEQGLWTIALLLVFAFLLSRTLFGFRLKAIGGSRAAAAVVRLPVTRYVFLAFVICAVMACLAGLLDFSFVGTASPNDGQADLFPVFAAVIIGGASLSGGKGGAIGTVTGALLLAVLANGFALIAAGPFAQQILLGTVTIGAVVIDKLTSRRAAT